MTASAGGALAVLLPIDPSRLAALAGGIPPWARALLLVLALLAPVLLAVVADGAARARLAGAWDAPVRVRRRRRSR